MSVNIYNNSAGTLTPVAGIPALKLTTLAENQADFEKTSTASKYYDAGAYILRANDKLYKTIVPVEAGTEWQVGANIIPVIIGSEIKSNYDSFINEFSNHAEKTNIATQSYAVGKYLQYTDEHGKPQFAKAISTIALSDSIVDGYNVQNMGLDDILNNFSPDTEYSEDEVAIGNFLGDPLFRKVIDIGGLPNATIKTVAHEIDKLKDVVRIQGYAQSSSGLVTLPIPRAGSQLSENIDCYVNGDNIAIKTNSDLSDYTKAYIVLEYTTSPVQTVTLTFLTHGGEIYATAKAYPGDTFPEIEDPTYPDSRFLGWSPTLPEVVPNIDTTYTSQWQDKVTLTFLGVNGSIYDTRTGYPGDTFPVIANPSQSGYRFLGWSPELPATIPNANTTYTSQWLSQVTLSFYGARLVYGPGGEMTDEWFLWKTTNAFPGDNFPDPGEAPVPHESWMTGWRPSLPSKVPNSNASYYVTFEG